MSTILLISTLKKIKILRIINRELFRLGLKRRFIRQPIIWIDQKLSGRKLLGRMDLLNNPEKYQVKRFGSEELISIEEPITIGEPPKELKEIFLSERIKTQEPGVFLAKFDKPFVCEVANAELAGPTAVGFEENGNVILETTVPQFKELDGHPEQIITVRSLALNKLPSSKIEQIDTAFSLVSPWSGNFYHWIIESLTRLEGLEYYREQTGYNPTLIINSNPASWQINSLKLLGYKPENWICWNGSRLRVKRLIVPSFRRSIFDGKFHGLVSPNACHWIARRMISNLPKPEGNEPVYSSKIYLSRQNVLVRKVVNEDEVMAALAPLGFVAYRPEEMSLSEQVRLFSQAKMLISPHSSGLLSMIFSQNLKVIELFGSYVENELFYLAAMMGFPYGYLKGRSPVTEIRKDDGDIIVDVPKLLELVAKMQE